eukprot:CAMPEP_0194309920 /NCGR_PEP_ID=MMETSP0171-20130528/6893_1 /TAXON_ID=218684 /ORGANISM="Corethron pennatum, Strain L29A3" /LENGTH=73 /DNA_ID=CAMNT_0039063307 /DNA_START=738 /DNA_END=956 /DNA_ORIENTATION=+
MVPKLNPSKLPLSQPSLDPSIAPSISPTPICHDVKDFKGLDAIESKYLTCEKLTGKNTKNKMKFCNRNTTYNG